MAGKRTMTPEQRQRLNAYHRKYCAEHPEKVKQWHENYVLRKAQRILDAASDTERDSDN